MEFTSLGSGSGGNGTVIRAGNTTLLIDCGFSRKELTVRMSRRGLDIEQLDAILVTHEHGDHLKGVPVVARTHQIPVYASRGTIDAMKHRVSKFESVEELVHEIEPGRTFRVKDINVHPIEVPHDVREPLQFVCRYDGIGVGVLTDCGSYTEQMVAHYSRLNGLLLETNHDSQMLATGPYPEPLKRRVGGDLGHLNNRQSREFAQRIHHINLQQLVLGHISQHNNERSLIEQEFDDFPSGTSVTYATQSGGTEWLSVTAGSV